MNRMLLALGLLVITATAAEVVRSSAVENCIAQASENYTEMDKAVIFLANFLKSPAIVRVTVDVNANNQKALNAEIKAQEEEWSEYVRQAQEALEHVLKAQTELIDYCQENPESPLETTLKMIKKSTHTTKAIMTANRLNQKILRKLNPIEKQWATHYATMGKDAKKLATLCADTEYPSDRFVEELDTKLRNCEIAQAEANKLTAKKAAPSQTPTRTQVPKIVIRPVAMQPTYLEQNVTSASE